MYTIPLGAKPANQTSAISSTPTSMASIHSAGNAPYSGTGAGTGPYSANFDSDDSSSVGSGMPECHSGTESARGGGRSTHSGYDGEGDVDGYASSDSHDSHDSRGSSDSSDSSDSSGSSGSSDSSDSSNSSDSSDSLGSDSSGADLEHLLPIRILVALMALVVAMAHLLSTAKAPRRHCTSPDPWFEIVYNYHDNFRQFFRLERPAFDDLVTRISNTGMLPPTGTAVTSHAVCATCRCTC